MTAAQQAYKKSLITRVHIAPKYQAFYRDNREEWEEKLFSHFSERSSKDLNISQLLALVAWLNHDLPDLPIIRDRKKEATDRQVTAIHALWSRYARDSSEEALRHFIKRITGNTYLCLDHLRREDATLTITALKKTLKER